MKIRFSYGNNEVPEYILEYVLQVIKDVLVSSGLHIGAITINTNIFDENGMMRSFVDESKTDIKELNVVIRQEPYKAKDRACDLLCTFPPNSKKPEAYIYWQRSEPKCLF